jgi:hypothetical protein
MTPAGQKHLQDAVTFAAICVMLVWLTHTPVTLSVAARFIVAFALVKLVSWAFWSHVLPRAGRGTLGVWRWLTVPLALLGTFGAFAVAAAALLRL